MKSKNFKIILLASVISLSISCKDDNNNHPINEATITVHSPAESETFSLGDTVNISATVEGEMDVHGYELFIRNKSNSDSLVFQYTGHNHGTVVNIDTFWVSNIAASSNMELEIAVTLDHDNNKEMKTVDFVTVP